MPKNYFETLPTIQYDMDRTGQVKLASNILTRIRRRSNLTLSGGIFYNYPMQEGDTPEIIADKYYGSSQYHWVVMLINDAYNSTYDFPLSSGNFDRYIADKYGSQARAQGVTKVISDANTYSTASVFSESHDYLQDSSNNSLITSGTIPAGNTTSIKLSASSDPFSTLAVGDVVELFVPSTWHNAAATDSSKLGYTQPAEIVSKSRRSDGTYVITTNMDSTRYPAFDWQEDGFLRQVSGTTSAPVTANQTHIFLATGTSADSYATNGFITFTSAGTADNPATLPADLIGNNFPIQSYNDAYKVVVLGEDYKLPEPHPDPTDAGYAPWNYTITYGGYHLTSGDIRIEGEDITLRSAVHHFEMDVYADDGETLLLEDHRITKNEYVDTTIGLAANKRIVSNYDFEVEDDNSKRNIILLKKELINSFITEFRYLLKED
jgi:hypothetical protein